MIRNSPNVFEDRDPGDNHHSEEVQKVLLTLSTLHGQQLESFALL